ncbi:Pre-rRNA-processing protein TSR2-domain-containing protein [Kalaharituber pfeilii]|nr:Pre-rRNA-processing protein TSR2-domain-containing protein [Kalaharituber pfeilii]
MSAPIPSPTPWELGVAYIIHLWPALTLAVTSNWGGANSAEKRDWLCGAIADMFPPLESSTSSNASEEPDEAYVEETLLQVMEDEFDVVVEDDSAAGVAAQILRLRAALREGNTAHLEALRIRFERYAKKPVAISSAQNGQDDDNDDDGEGGDTDEMEDADAVPSSAPLPAPVIDEEGFELVQSKGRRKR